MTPCNASPCSSSLLDDTDIGQAVQWNGQCECCTVLQLKTSGARACSRNQQVYCTHNRTDYFHILHRRQNATRHNLLFYQHKAK